MTPEQVRRKITVYVSRIDARLVERATSDTRGDCWDCKLTVQANNGTTVCMGDFYQSYEHLGMHIQERYYPGSMFANAWLEKSGSTKQPPSLEALREAVKEYLEKRLLPTGGSPIGQKGSTRPGGLSA